jgi:hypothetical protein
METLNRFRPDDAIRLRIRQHVEHNNDAIFSCRDVCFDADLRKSRGF